MRKIQKQEQSELNYCKKEKAITLIALVITIIVLLILAGVSIATLTGENGILTRANDAKTETEIAEEKEKVELSALASLAEDLGGEIDINKLRTELGRYFEDGKYDVQEGISEDGIEGYIVTITENDQNGRKYFVDKNGNITEYIVREPAEPTEGEAEAFTMANGVIEVEFLNGVSYNTTTRPNHPVLKEGMTAITYNDVGMVQNVSNSNNADWYSYVETTDSDMTDGGTTNGGNSQWANAEVTTIVNDQEIKSYFVWIPRYAYRIIYFNTSESENAYRAGKLTEEEALANNQIVGYSDARGIVDKEGKQVKDIAQQTAISVNDKYFKTHPAFENNVDYGGWSSKLKGIWVAKYEASSVEGNSNGSGDNVTTKHIKIQPEEQSWRYITIGNAFTNAKNYNIALNSHLMKNSEWGAVAYLTESKYGRNGTEININNNSNYLTGNAGNNISESSNSTTNAFNTQQGMLASTTGNIYGIYDLSGGAWEYMAGYYAGGSDLTNGSSFVDGTSNEYSTVYTGTTASTAYKYGDAIYETSGWNDDIAVYFTSGSPFLERGGFHGRGVDAGGFSFIDMTGGSNGARGFRICLVLQ